MLDDTVPLYPLYVVLFAASGLTGGQISALFVVWSATGLLTEVPTGALADRFSRRSALTAAGVLKAAGYLLWTTLPGFTGFAAGFVLWGLSSSLVSGALEALLYEGLTEAGVPERYPTVTGRITAIGLLAQIPSAIAATVLYAAGGFHLAGWVSIACCLASALLATRLPQPPRTPDDSDEDSDSDGYFATLRAGVREASQQPAVRAAIVVLALVGGIDALEEYFPLLAHSWGVPTNLVPLAVLGIPLAGAAGAATAAHLTNLRPNTLAALLGVGATILAIGGLLHTGVGVIGVAAFYALYRAVLVVVDARCQERITGTARATVTSVAAVGTELTCFLVYGAWAVGQILGVAILTALIAISLTTRKNRQ
jgi:MFS family permease